MIPSKDGLLICHEKPSGYHATEWAAEQAFYNVFRPGCLEHLLLHRLRSAPAYLPALSYIAQDHGEIVGGIFYSKAVVDDGTRQSEVLALGPLFVIPALRKEGLGTLLVQKTLRQPASSAYPAVFLFGHPSYYPRFGFKGCSAFGITTSEGENFPAFMALELRRGALKGLRGRYVENPVFASLTPEGAEDCDRRFPPLEKKVLPGQFTS
jgi:predicted N-acetyltransferase YhbS